MKFKSFNVEQLAAKKAQLVQLKAEIAELVLVVKQEKINQAEARQFERESKAAAREFRRQQQIEKMEARLAKLKSPKRPSKVKVYTGSEAQEMVA